MSDDLVVRAVSGEVVDLNDAPLTDKQKMFVAYYCGQALGNGEKAARLAGYADPNQSAFDCKKNPIIAAIIAEKIRTLIISGDETMARISAHATAPTEHFMREEHAAYVDEDGKYHEATFRLDYSTQIKALELLGKYHKILSDKVDVDVAFVPKRLVGVSEDDL